MQIRSSLTLTSNYFNPCQEPVWVWNRSFWEKAANPLFPGAASRLSREQAFFTWVHFQSQQKAEVCGMKETPARLKISAKLDNNGNHTGSLMKTWTTSHVQGSYLPLQFLFSETVHTSILYTTRWGKFPRKKRKNLVLENWNWSDFRKRWQPFEAQRTQTPWLGVRNCKFGHQEAPLAYHQLTTSIM